MKIEEIEIQSMTQSEDAIRKLLESQGMEGEVTTVTDQPIDDKTNAPPAKPAGDPATEQPSEPVAPIPPDGETGEGTTAAAPETAPVLEQPKPRESGAQRQKRRLAAKDAEIEELKARLAGTPAAQPSTPAPEKTPEKSIEKKTPEPAGTTVPDDDPKPLLADFDGEDAYDEWTDAKHRWTVRDEQRKIQSKEEAARVAKAAEEARKTAETTRQSAERYEQAHENRWQERLKTAKVDHPDYDAVIANPQAQASPVMQLVIKDSDVGTDLAYYLGSHPEESRRITALTDCPVDVDPAVFRAKHKLAILELHKIEQIVEAENLAREEEVPLEEDEPAAVAAPAVEAAAVPQPQSQAPPPTPKPAPPSTVGNRGTTSRKTLAQMTPAEMANLSGDEYRRRRAAGEGT